MNYSSRVQAMDASPIRKLYPKELEARARGLHVIHANIGQPDLPTPDAFRQGIMDHLTPQTTLAYGPSEGLPEFRRACADFYQRQGIEVLPRHILATTAGSEALLFVLLAICEVGDEILVPEPFYTNYRTFCFMAGVRLVSIPTYWETGFSLPPLSEIETLVTERTRAILFCSPGNPTGVVYSRESIDALLELCVHKDLWLVADEVYRDFAYVGQHFSILQSHIQWKKRIVVDSLSKRYSACGSRLGMIVSYDLELLAQILKMAQARLCPPTLDQQGAITLIDSSDRAILDMKDTYARRIDHLCALLDAIPGVSYIKPHGSFYVMVRLPVEDSERFASYLLEKVAVDGRTLMVAPAAGFYATVGRGRSEIRIAAVLDEMQLTQVAEILRIGLEKYSQLPA
jgi:aspartate aminotransferase